MGLFPYSRRAQPTMLYNDHDLADLEKARLTLEEELKNPALFKDQKLYTATARRHSELTRLVGVWRKFLKASEDIEGTRLLLEDSNPGIRELAEMELPELERLKKDLDAELKLLLLPKDPNDAKNTVVEIRAGAGGDEAALFANDLYRMYLRYAEGRGWKADLLSLSPSDAGGFKEVIFLVEGDGVYSHLKHESGVHRVQRVPATETQGRIHTSTVTVAVLPEAEEVEVDIRAEDIKVDVYRSSGPGGQSVNTTDSAVRVTHLPTGLVVTCQDEKSQIKNKQKALTVLRARLLDRQIAERDQKISSERREQVGSGDRSERIRTYNFPQGRLTDHRVGLTLYKLPEIINGDLAEVIGAVGSFFEAKRLASWDND
ncbi:MAG: peptide chain release factor 1 [Deltaproteobacteria bacterium]|jgi:peptide chain release factor 1|nr:peptide chain release factor 1 [Deltaproteobacteria bacterium]